MCTRVHSLQNPLLKISLYPTECRERAQIPIYIIFRALLSFAHYIFVHRFSCHHKYTNTHIFSPVALVYKSIHACVQLLYTERRRRLFYISRCDVIYGPSYRQSTHKHMFSWRHENVQRYGPQKAPCCNCARRRLSISVSHACTRESNIVLWWWGKLGRRRWWQMHALSLSAKRPIKYINEENSYIFAHCNGGTVAITSRIWSRFTRKSER